MRLLHPLNILLISNTFILLKLLPKFILSNEEQSSNIEFILKQLETSKLLISKIFIFDKPLKRLLIFFTFDVSNFSKDNEVKLPQLANIPLITIKLLFSIVGN